MLVGKIVILIDIIGSFLLFQVPCREQILVFARMERSNCNYFWLTLTLVFSSGALAILIPDIESAFGFFGAFGAVFIGIYYPYSIKVSLSRQPWNSGKNLFLVIQCVILCVVTGIAAVLSGIRLFKPGFTITLNF